MFEKTKEEWKKRREERKENFKQIGKDWKKAKEELKEINKNTLKEKPKKQVETKKVWLGVLIILLIVTIIIILFGDSPEEASRKQSILTQQAMAENIKNSKCPKQGVMQSDYSYCIDLAMIGHDSDTSEAIAEKQCDSFERLGIETGIKRLKCQKCGECTTQQLQTIENECNSGCNNQFTSKDGCYCPEINTTYKICQNCTEQFNQCVITCKATRTGN